MTQDQKFKAVLEGTMPPMFLSEDDMAELELRVFNAIVLKKSAQAGASFYNPESIVTQ